MNGVQPWLEVTLSKERPIVSIARVFATVEVSSRLFFHSNESKYTNQTRLVYVVSFFSSVRERRVLGVGVFLISRQLWHLPNLNFYRFFQKMLLARRLKSSKDGIKWCMKT